MSSVLPAPQLRSELSVAGMTCGNCVRHVHAALVEIPGVVAVVDLESATASVDHPASVTVQHLIEALDEAGYDATPRDAERR